MYMLLKVIDPVSTLISLISLYKTDLGLLLEKKNWAGVYLYVMIFVHPLPFSNANIKRGRDRTEEGALGTKGNLNRSTNFFRYGDRQDSKDSRNNILLLNFLITI